MRVPALLLFVPRGCVSMRQVRQKKLRLLRTYGLFWGYRFLTLKASWSGYNLPLMYGKFLRRLVWLNLDGSFGGGYLSNRRVFFNRRRARNTSRSILNFFLWGTSTARAWSWCILRSLKIRSYRGFRYRLGLPSRGQKTRSNCKTTRKVKDVAASILRADYVSFNLWERSKYAQIKLVKYRKTISKRAAKAARHKKGVIRSTKKKDVWK